MIRLYRAVKVIAGRPLPDLSGISAKYEDGTWHKKFAVRDTRLVYTCEHPSTCLIEIMVNMGGSIVLPDELYMLEIIGLEENDIRRLPSLPENWHKTPHLTQKIGMDWLNSHESLALRVPSKVAYESYNILLNPLHKDFDKISIDKSVVYKTDDRFHV
jgi:RES domain-containing protein